MNPIIARCGFRCDLYPAYRGNVGGPEDQPRTSDGWFNSFGFRIPPERILCDGCLDPRPDARRIETSCPLRVCGQHRGLPGCAECADPACQKYDSRAVCRARGEKHLGAPLPPTEYVRFVVPYERRQCRRAANHPSP